MWLGMPDQEFPHLVHPEGTNLRTPGIYLRTVNGQTYVGKASNLRSRLNEYLNNIRKIEVGLPYRKGSPKGFRRVHVELANAKAKGISAEWKVLEFCSKGEFLLLRERHWISTLAPTLNGPNNGKIHEP